MTGIPMKVVKPCGSLALVIFLLSALPIVVGAQSTVGFIILSNYDSNNPIFVFDGVAVTLAPARGTFAQVLGGPSADRLEVLRSDGFGTDTFEFAEPGFFYGEAAFVPGTVSGGSGWFEIRGWRGGATWEEANRNPEGFVGRSGTFENPVGVWDFPGAANPQWLRAPSFTLFQVPEPSPLVLLTAGLAIFLTGSTRYFRRQR